MVQVAGTSYAARFRHADGSESTVSLTTVAGESANLVFAAPVDPGLAPAVGDLVMHGVAGSETVDCLVKSICHAGDFRATLSLIDAAPGVHDADTGSIPGLRSADDGGSDDDSAGRGGQSDPDRGGPVPVGPGGLGRGRELAAVARRLCGRL